MAMDRRRGILLIDHGSRRQAANDQLAQLASQLALSYGDDVACVEAAHMELASPTIADGIAACLAVGVTSLTIVPCMLSRGRHVTEDLPRLIGQALVDRDIPWRIAAPLAEQPAFVALLRLAADESNEE